MPSTSVHTDAWFIVSFPVKFDVKEDIKKGVRKQDPYLINKLTTAEELSGIFNILMNALRYILINEKIFTNDKTTEERRVKYQSAVDTVHSFLEVAIDIESTETSCTTKEVTYMAFVEYCKIHRLSVLTKDAFGKSMTNHEVDKGFATIGGKKYRVWKGIQLTAEYNVLAMKALIQKQKTIDGIKELT